MIQDEPTLRDLLSQTHLVDAAVATLEVSGTAEIAFAIDIPTEDPVSTWSLLRELMPQTGRWPLLTTSWSKGSSWEATVTAADFFDRSAFQWERMKGDRSGDTPADVIAAAASLDSEADLNALASQSEANLIDELEIALGDTQRRFGVTPAIEHPEGFLTSQHIHSHFGLERCFFEWERHNVADALELKTDDLAYLDWFDAHADGLIILLMPSPRPWEVPAYIHWFGSESHSSQLTVAMLYRWHLLYGAELVAHYGTMLELITTRLPETPEDALQLAWEQETLAPCTTLLPGVCLRDHARSLLHTHRWFLHERP